jgi:hypothetical protein
MQAKMAFDCGCEADAEDAGSGEGKESLVPG